MSDEQASPPAQEPRPRVPIRIEEALAALAIAAMGLITFANVVTRYVSNVSLAFTEEYAIALMVVMTMLGTAVAVVRNHHIRITFFVELLPPGARRAVELFTLGITALVFAGLAGYGTLMVRDEYRFEVTSPGLGLPQWIYSIWLPVLSAWIVARTLGRLIRVWRGDER